MADARAAPPDRAIGARRRARAGAAVAPRALAGLLALLVLIAAAVGLAAAREGGAGAATAPVLLAQSTAAAPPAEVPQKARDVLAEIEKRSGEPPSGYVGGRVFQNRERLLPRGRYREYDVNPKVRGRDRGPERIVIERGSGKAYYTPDHYETFIRMN
jgi:ribonuclease T1